MEAPGRDWRMIAAGVALALVVLAVVGRLQSRGLGTDRAGPSVPTPATGSADGTSASGLSLTGRVALPGRPVAVAVGEGAVWVLSGAGGAWPNQTGWLLRLDPRSGRVTATTPLPQLFANQTVGPVIGGDAVWVIGQSSQLSQGGSVLLRIDPASGRVTGWFRSRLALKGLLAAGPRGAWVVTGASELLHVIPA